MATDLPAAEANALADYQASRITHFSLHTGATSGTGANEAAGGGYARVASNFTAAGAVGPMGSGAQPATTGVAWGSVTFSAASAGTYPVIGMQSASSAGTFRGSDDLPSPYTHVSGSTPTWSVAVGPGVT